jgi:hypothetical protein
MGNIIIVLIALAFAVLIDCQRLEKFLSKPASGLGRHRAIYNLILMLQIAKTAPLVGDLLIIPIVSVVIAIVVCIDIDRHFGKGPGSVSGCATGVHFFRYLVWRRRVSGLAIDRSPGAARSLESLHADGVHRSIAVQQSIALPGQQ